MADEKKQDEQYGTDDQEVAKPAETETSGAGYGNNAGPQDEVDEK